MSKYAQNGLRMHLLQSRISKCLWGGEGGPPYPPPLAPMVLNLCLRHSTLSLHYKLRLLLQFFFRGDLMGRFDLIEVIS